MNVGERMEAIVADLSDASIQCSENGHDMLAMVLHAAAASITDAYEMHVETACDD